MFKEKLHCLTKPLTLAILTGFFLVTAKASTYEPLGATSLFEVSDNLEDIIRKIDDLPANIGAVFNKKYHARCELAINGEVQLKAEVSLDGETLKNQVNLDDSEKVKNSIALFGSSAIEYRLFIGVGTSVKAMLNRNLKFLGEMTLPTPKAELITIGKKPMPHIVSITGALKPSAVQASNYIYTEAGTIKHIVTCQTYAFPTPPANKDENSNQDQEENKQNVKEFAI